MYLQVQPRIQNNDMLCDVEIKTETLVNMTVFLQSVQSSAQQGGQQEVICYV